MTKVQKKQATIKTAYGSFPCIFEREPDMGGYAAEAPTVQGAVSWGKNLVEAKKMIAEAIEGVIEIRVIVKAERDGEVRINRRPRAAQLA